MSPEGGPGLSAAAKLAMSLRVVVLAAWLLPAALASLVFVRQSRD
jgi:hypothetical protein